MVAGDQAHDVVEDHDVDATEGSDQCQHEVMACLGVEGRHCAERWEPLGEFILGVARVDQQVAWWWRHAGAAQCVDRADLKSCAFSNAAVAPSYCFWSCAIRPR